MPESYFTLDKMRAVVDFIKRDEASLESKDYAAQIFITEPHLKAYLTAVVETAIDLLPTDASLQNTTYVVEKDVLVRRIQAAILKTFYMTKEMIRLSLEEHNPAKEIP